MVKLRATEKAFCTTRDYDHCTDPCQVNQCKIIITDDIQACPYIECHSIPDPEKKTINLLSAGIGKFYKRQCHCT